MDRRSPEYIHFTEQHADRSQIGSGDENLDRFYLGFNHEADDALSIGQCVWMMIQPTLPTHSFQS